MREPTELRLAEDEAVIDGHFEAALRPAAERELDKDGRPCPRNLGRQTDGLVEIVSGDAVLNRDAVLRIKHVPSLAEPEESEGWSEAYPGTYRYV